MHLVVDLQHQLAVVPPGLERLVDAHQRHLEDVGGQALDAGVHRLALAGLTDPAVRVEQLGDRAATPEQRLGVARSRASIDRASMYAFTFGNATK